MSHPSERTQGTLRHMVANLIMYGSALDQKRVSGDVVVALLLVSNINVLLRQRTVVLLCASALAHLRIGALKGFMQFDEVCSDDAALWLPRTLEALLQLGRYTNKYNPMK